MSETLEKLRADRDLQCYFFRPSAIAALSNAGPTGFTVSGTWRQQFDWTVIEWNRDNVFEHRLLRNLPDGDLSSLTLSYRETRTNCILMDSKLFPTVDWPYLRIWADDAGGQEQLYRVRLADYATPTQGSFVAAQATFTLQGTLTVGDVAELSWLDEHYFRTIASGDTIASVLQNLASDITVLSSTVSATSSPTDITLTNLEAGEEGSNLGIVGTVSGAQTEAWSPVSQTMSGGASPTEWQVDIDFGTVLDENSMAIPTQKVRKMRWTYAAALQQGPYSRSEFDVVVSNWSVSGTNRSYKVADPKGRVFEDNTGAVYVGSWIEKGGNFSGGTIHLTDQVGDNVTVTYTSQFSHRLFLGSRRALDAGIVSVTVDSQPAQVFDLYIADEDFLLKLDLGTYDAGTHTAVATLTGANPAASPGSDFFFDYVEEVVEAPTVNAEVARPTETLATDWDTDHSVALAPERVAWNINMLGFHGRANHYTGAILFYELTNIGNVYAQGTVTFQGTPVFSQNVQVVIDGSIFNRLTLSTDTNESITKSFEFLINNGSTGVWASSSGNVLTIHARGLGTAGNAITLSASPTSGGFQAVASGSTLSGGADGQWLTDTTSAPRLNRAARDWHRAYFIALDGYGIEATASFSMELSHGDSSLAAGIAQRYPDGPVVLNTPALQTNFSPTSLDFWKQVYLEMAQLQDEAQATPYLQFGEVQWWYFPNSAGMTFYDDYTKTEFQNQYGRAIHVFTSNTESPDPHPEEAAFLPGLIGTFTQAIRDFVKATYPQAKFEVLYPHDVNDFALTRPINYPDSDWTPANLDVLKTENFTYTGARNLDKAVESIRFPQDKGFPRNRAAHLVGVFNSSEPWNWERRLCRAELVESVVFWAFDQFSIISYRLPLSEGIRRSRFVR